MSFRRERSGESLRGFTNLTRRGEIILRNRDRAWRRRRAREGIGRESVETAERTPRADRADLRFDRNRSHHDRARAPQRRRSEQIIIRPERRHADDIQSREPVLSHRIVGRDVDVKEERMYELLPAPDPELHVRTWRSLNRAYPKANIVEMVTGLDREYMEFARIIITSLPATSIVDMRRRGMMEDIQRVTGLGTSNDFQGYGDDGYFPSTVNRYSCRKVPSAPEISSDEPMDDYQSSDDNNGIHRGRLISKSANHRLTQNARPKSSQASISPLESLWESDKNEEELFAGASGRPTPLSISAVPLASVSRPDARSLNNISTDQAEINRFRECFAETHTTLAGRRASVKDEVLAKHMDKAPLLIKLFKYEAMLKSVLHLLESGNCSIPPARNHEPRLEADIPADIYRVVEQSYYKVKNTAQSRLREAHILLDLNQVFEAEIVRRNLDPLMTHNNRENPVVASIKLDMACASTGRSRRDLVEMQTANNQLYKNCMAPVYRMRGHGLRVFAYTNTFGSSAALLIWPWLPVQAITGIALHKQQYVFIEGISRFLKGSDEYRAIRALINHLSTWFEGWMAGTISSEVAIKRLEAFSGIRGTGGLPPGELADAQINRSTCDSPGTELQQLIDMFSEIPRADNATYSAVGTAGHTMSLNITDMESLGSQRQLTERAIEAVLATTKFPEGVMFALASGYGSLYDQQDYEHERSMSINQGIKTILCPVHTGESTQHWVGVVVRLDYNKRGLRPGISMILLDSLATDANNPIYDEQIIRKIVETWLRNRLPDFKSFGFNGGLARPRVEQQVDLNSCGVHMLLNLRAAGLDGKYISKGASCTNKEWIDNARESFVERILRSAGKHLGGDVESTINELLDEPVLSVAGSWSRTVLCRKIVRATGAGVEEGSRKVRRGDKEKGKKRAEGELVSGDKEKGEKRADEEEEEEVVCIR
ncbi:hypothetical protein V496_06649 [Pseudogymnoascus sp. VKM F-4515 (FW-2607)]|nr:hypothetical protein V496_06649 [Pseudogymnoascus sp. VKM F-4515 (FW-2607)]